jgi:hypothetical protein
MLDQSKFQIVGMTDIVGFIGTAQHVNPKTHSVRQKHGVILAGIPSKSSFDKLRMSGFEQEGKRAIIRPRVRSMEA